MSQYPNICGLFIDISKNTNENSVQAFSVALDEALDDASNIYGVLFEIRSALNYFNSTFDQGADISDDEVSQVIDTVRQKIMKCKEIGLSREILKIIAVDCSDGRLCPHGYDEIYRNAPERVYRELAELAYPLGVGDNERLITGAMSLALLEHADLDLLKRCKLPAKVIEGIRQVSARTDIIRLHGTKGKHMAMHNDFEP